MLKIVSLLYRNPALSPQQFREYWEQVHVPLVRAALPGLIHYSGSFPVGEAGSNRPGKAIDCDAVVELGFPDRATMERDMASPGFNTPEREASSARLMDLGRTQTLLVEDVNVDLKAPI